MRAVLDGLEEDCWGFAILGVGRSRSPVSSRFSRFKFLRAVFDGLEEEACRDSAILGAGSSLTSFASGGFEILHALFDGLKGEGCCGVGFAMQVVWAIWVLTAAFRDLFLILSARFWKGSVWTVVSLFSLWLVLDIGDSGSVVPTVVTFVCRDISVTRAIVCVSARVILSWIKCLVVGQLL